MAQELENMAASLLDGERGEALRQNAKDIEKLARSRDGQRVRAMLGDEKQVAKALEQGDTEELRRLMTRVLSSEEGSRLARQLMDFLG